MTWLHVIEIAVFGSALIASGWGMLFFFKKPSGRVPGTRGVGGLAIAFAVWHVWAVTTTTPGWVRGRIACVLYACAVTLFVWAVRSSRGQPLTAIFVQDVPRHILRDGAFRYMRHPFYVSYAIFWLAGWAATGSWIALLSVIVMGATYMKAADAEEEKFRVSPMAAEYENYRRLTPAYPVRRPRTAR